MKKFKKCSSKEDGNILILFAGFLVLLIFMIGIMLDLGMIYMKRNELTDLCQLAREERFSRQDTIRYSDDPGAETYKIIWDCLQKNGFKGDVKVYFREEQPEWNYRYYKVRIVLSDDYHYTFLRLFHLDTQQITVFFDGDETYGEGGNDMIWHPRKSYTEYSGCYTGDPSDPTVRHFSVGEFPDSW